MEEGKPVSEPNGIWNFAYGGNMNPGVLSERREITPLESVAGRLDDYRLRLGHTEYVPIVIGGMGVDISSAALAHEAARLGGIGHISDAMSPYVSDRYFAT